MHQGTMRPARLGGVEGRRSHHRRVLLVNGREWKPDVLQLDVIAGLTVQGWQDDRVASLVFQTGGAAVTIDQIAEREMAQRLAASLRSRIPNQ
jgi:hypothetical protein